MSSEDLNLMFHDYIKQYMTKILVFRYCEVDLVLDACAPIHTETKHDIASVTKV